MGQPIPDAVFMVMSRRKSKVYYYFSFTKIDKTRIHLQIAICSVLTLRYTGVNAASGNQRRTKYGEIPDHLIINFIECRSKVTAKVTCSKFLVPLERYCHKKHTYRIRKPYLLQYTSYGLC